MEFNPYILWILHFGIQKGLWKSELEYLEKIVTDYAERLSRCKPYSTFEAKKPEVMPQVHNCCLSNRWDNKFIFLYSTFNVTYCMGQRDTHIKLLYNVTEPCLKVYSVYVEMFQWPQHFFFFTLLRS